MASSMDNFDKLMMAMALKRIVEGSEDLKLHPFTCEIIATPMSIVKHTLWRSSVEKLRK